MRAVARSAVQVDAGADGGHVELGFGDRDSADRLAGVDRHRGQAGGRHGGRGTAGTGVFHGISSLGDG